MEINVDQHIQLYGCTWEKFTITGRICATQSWGSNSFPRAAQPSTANNLTESWSEMKINCKLTTQMAIILPI